VILHFLAVACFDREESIFSRRIIPDWTLIIIEDVARRDTLQVGRQILDEGADVSRTHLEIRAIVLLGIGTSGKSKTPAKSPLRKTKKKRVKKPRVPVPYRTYPPVRYRTYPPVRYRTYLP